MKRRLQVVFLVGLAAVNSTVSTSARGQGGEIGHSGAIEAQTRGWQVENKCGTPVWIAMNFNYEGSGVERRELFLFIESRNFSEDNLRKTIVAVAAEYNTPRELYITTFSNAEMLEREATMSQSPLCFLFTKDHQGKIDRDRFYATYYPAYQGYFRAYYSRSKDGTQSLRYSPDPNTKVLQEIQIKN